MFSPAAFASCYQWSIRSFIKYPILQISSHVLFSSKAFRCWNYMKVPQQLPAFPFPKHNSTSCCWPCEGLGIVGTIMVVVDCFCDSFCLIYLPGFPTLFQMVEALLHYLLCIFDFLKTLFLMEQLKYIPHTWGSFVQQLGVTVNLTTRD